MDPVRQALVVLGLAAAGAAILVAAVALALLAVVGALSLRGSPTDSWPPLSCAAIAAVWAVVAAVCLAAARY